MNQPDSALYAAAQRLVECYQFDSNGPSLWLNKGEHNRALISLKGVVDALEWAKKKAFVPTKAEINA